MPEPMKGLLDEDIQTASKEFDPTQLTPEEQEQFQQAFLIGSDLLYKNKGVSRKIAEMIRKPPHFQGIGGAAAILVSAADTKMGDALQETLLLPLGFVFTDLVVDMGTQLEFFTPDAELLEKALSVMTKMLDQQYGGQKSPQDAMPQKQPGVAEPPGATSVTPGQAPTPQGIPGGM